MSGFDPLGYLALAIAFLGGVGAFQVARSQLGLKWYWNLPGAFAVMVTCFLTIGWIFTVTGTFQALILNPPAVHFESVFNGVLIVGFWYWLAHSVKTILEQHHRP